MKRTFAFVTFFRAISILSMLGAVSPALQASQEAVPVTLLQPDFGSIAQIEKTTGELAAVRRAALQMKSKGTIEKMFVREGERVQRGQILASLEQKSFQLGMNQAQSLNKAADSQVKAAETAVAAASTGVHQAEVRLRTILRDYDRAKGLREKDAISQQQFDQIDAQFQLAEVGLESAKKQLLQAKAGLEVAEAQTSVTRVGIENARQRQDEANLYAPFDGLITAKLIQENEPCGERTLYQLVDDSELELTVKLSERFLPFVKPGNRLIVHSSLAAEPLISSVSLVIPSINPETLTFTAKAILDNRDHRLSHGGYADVEVVVRENRDVQIVPANIVRLAKESGSDDKGKPLPGFVFSARDGKACQIEVMVGITSNNQIAILSGLASGTGIVDRGFGQVKDGTPVKVIEDGRDEKGLAQTKPSAGILFGGIAK